LLFVGRLERLKGVEVAIRALALLRDRAHEEKTSEDPGRYGKNRLIS